MDRSRNARIDVRSINSGFIEAHLGWFGMVGVISTGALLVYQHSTVKSDDLSRLNAAFFTTNAFVSVILFVTIASEVFLSR